MKIKIISSGSKANCTLISCGKINLLIDAGATSSFIVSELEKQNISPNEINGVIITHTHSDHIKGLKVFVKTSNCLVYIKEDGEILSNHLNVKNTLDLLRIVSKGNDEPIKEAYNIFNEFTNDGKDMTLYSELLSQSINSIINIKEENDIDSLFRTGGTTMLKNDIKGLEDFELITFMVVV